MGPAQALYGSRSVTVPAHRVRPSPNDLEDAVREIAPQLLRYGLARTGDGALAEEAAHLAGSQRTPPRGDAVMTCTGKARPPIIAVGFNSTVQSFGTVPAGSTRNRTLLIQNAGEKDLNVSVAAAPAGAVFQWPAFNGVVPFGGSQSLTLTFAPPSEESFAAALSVASDDPDSPHAISLSGTGCVANAAIDAPAATRTARPATASTRGGS